MVEAVRNLVGACVAQERLLLEYLVVLVRWGTVSITDREDDGGDDDGGWRNNGDRKRRASL